MRKKEREKLKKEAGMEIWENIEPILLQYKSDFDKIEKILSLILRHNDATSKLLGNSSLKLKVKEIRKNNIKIKGVDIYT